MLKKTIPLSGWEQKGGCMLETEKNARLLVLKSPYKNLAQASVEKKGI
jgi:hypothetical protein